MKKAIKRILLMVILVFAFGLVGCGTTLSTNLSISDNFAGSRKMDVSIKKDEFDENAPEGGFKTLAEETAKITPECMEFSYEETKAGEYVFHFVMAFTSKEEYDSQIADILGRGYTTEFVYSKSPFAKEISVKEDFSSEDLLKWFRDYLVEQEYVDSDNAAYIFTKLKNTVSINGKEYTCNTAQLNVEKKTYIAIEAINFFTDIDAINGKIARKIELVFDDDIIEKNRTAVENYLTLVTPEGCVGEWQVLDGTEKYILIIPASTQEEMTAFMQTFCDSQESSVQLILSESESEEADEESEDEASYSDTWDEEILGNFSSKSQADSSIYVQPFGYETTIAENLDLSSFACNSWGEIESSYYVSTKNGKPESMIYLPSGEVTYGWDYIDDTQPDYYFVETTWQTAYQVVSKVNKYYVPSSVELNTEIKSEDNMKREFIFFFDESFEKDVADKIEKKLDTLFAAHKDLISVDISNKSKKADITWTIEGSVSEVDALCEEIFGKGYSDISYYCQDRFVLNRQYDYKESIDFRPIFDWKYSGNIDYTLKMPGKITKDTTYVVGGVDSEAKISGKKISYIAGQSGHLSASVTGEATNTAMIAVVIALVVFMLLVIGVVVLLIVKAAKSQPAQEENTKRDV